MTAISESGKRAVVYPGAHDKRITAVNDPIVASPYLQRDASVEFARRRRAVLPLCGVTAEGDQVVVAVAVGDQGGRAAGLEEI